MEEHPCILIHLIYLLLSFKKSVKVLKVKSKYTDTDFFSPLNIITPPQMQPLQCLCERVKYEQILQNIQERKKKT